MIYADMKDLKRYMGLGENMDIALGYLMSHSLDELCMGRNEVRDDKVFINRFDYETMEECKAAFEAHEKYADIHVVVSGEEFIGVSDISLMNITRVDKETDSIDCDGPVENRIHMEPGKVLVVFPEDAHKVKIAAGSPGHVKKAVVKVLVNISAE